jgi:hypothetical protein
MDLARASKAGKAPVVSLECTSVAGASPTVTVTSKEELRPAAPE